MQCFTRTNGSVPTNAFGRTYPADAHRLYINSFIKAFMDDEAPVLKSRHGCMGRLRCWLSVLGGVVSAVSFDFMTRALCYTTAPTKAMVSRTHSMRVVLLCVVIVAILLSTASIPSLHTRHCLPLSCPAYVQLGFKNVDVIQFSENGQGN